MGGVQPSPMGGVQPSHGWVFGTKLVGFGPKCGFLVPNVVVLVYFGPKCGGFGCILVPNVVVSGTHLVVSGTHLVVSGTICDKIGVFVTFCQK